MVLMMAESERLILIRFWGQRSRYICAAVCLVHLQHYLHNEFLWIDGTASFLVLLLVGFDKDGTLKMNLYIDVIPSLTLIHFEGSSHFPAISFHFDAPYEFIENIKI